jgi:glycosyltransferase involved in cell wall biosynthesis
MKLDKIRIFYDNYIFIKQSNGGIKTYFQNLIKYNKKFIPYFEQYNRKHNFFYKNIIGIFISQNFYFLRPFFYSLFKKNLNLKIIYHGTYYLNPFLSLINCKKVITIHDLIPEIYFENIGGLNKINLKIIKAARKFSINNSDHIITPSETTKKDLISHYPQVKNKDVSVIKHGIDHFSDQNLIEKNIAEFEDIDFILYVGSRAYYKGFYDLINAYALVLKKEKNLRLICAGSDFTKEEIQYFVEKKISLKNIISFRPNNGELKFLYKKSKAFIYPSRYEGFGFPPLEAIVSGAKNIICSSIPTTQEICSGFVKYYKVGSSEKLAELILESFTNKKRVYSAEEHILKRYSWENSAKKHLEVYTKLLS